MRGRLVVFIVIVQSILLVVHLYLFETWIFFWGPIPSPWILRLQVMLGSLSLSFVGASLLAIRFSNFLVRVFYRLSAIWLGLLNFFFLAAGSCWLFYAISRLFAVRLELRSLAIAFFGLAIFTSLYGFLNASRIRVKRITIKLPNLPESWRGRTAALVSDLHLGHVRNLGFVRRIVAMLARLRPHAIFITGDLYDGTAADIDGLAQPWANLPAPLGAYFITGNHEEFSDRTKYLQAVKRSGVRILNNEKITVDGLQIVGVHYRDSVNVQGFKSILDQADLDRGSASILLVHAPNSLPIAEEAGISLQLSGHTHRGQFIPFTRIVSRIYRQYAYGLQRFGNLMVYTSSGAGTWGPPMRVGTNPEIVLIQFD